MWLDATLGQSNEGTVVRQIGSLRQLGAWLSKNDRQGLAARIQTDIDGLQAVAKSIARVDRHICPALDALRKAVSSNLGVVVTAAMGLPSPVRMPMTQQDDGHSCGDFLLAGVETLARRFAHNDFSLDLADVARNRQAIIEGFALYDQFAAEHHAGQAKRHPMQAGPRRRRWVSHVEPLTQWLHFDEGSCRYKGFPTCQATPSRGESR